MKKLLKIAGCALAAVILLVLVAITVAVNYLKPERLTPMVERLAADYVNADLTLGRAEISFYSTFPRFQIDIQDLNIRTKAFDALPDSITAALPAYADSLLSLQRLTAAVNVPKLLIGTIALYDIDLVRLRANIVQATPEVSGLDIFPESEEVAEEETEELSIPDFSFGTFRVTDGLGMRYHSVPDSIAFSATLTALEAGGDAAPVYRLDVGGNASADIAALTISRLSIGLGGNVNWDPDSPYRLALDKVKLEVGDVRAQVNSHINFENTDSIRVETFDITFPETPYNAYLALIPADMRGELAKVTTDMVIGMGARLTAPYIIGVDSIPSMAVNVNIPECSATYDGMSLDKFELRADGTIDGRDFNQSAFTLHRLYAQGEGMGFSLTGKVENPIHNQWIEGQFKGGVSVAHLPRKLLNLIPGDPHGLLKANLDFALRSSYFTKENFHRIRLSGDATLSDLDYTLPDDSISIASRLMELKFGTTNSFTAFKGHHVDSLLTLSLKIDTVSCALPGMNVSGSNLAMGIGCRNTGSSSDTTLINPVGARISAGRLIYHSDTDSLRVRLGKATIGASLTRYKGDARKPRLSLDIASKSALYADPGNRALLTDLLAAVTVHPTSRQPRRHASKHTNKLPTAALAADTLPSQPSAFSFLRKWEAHGTIRAGRAMARTPYFPIRSRIKGLNIGFSTDSVVIHETDIRLGRSDFKVKGKISNIARALTSRSGRQHMAINLDLSSDTINVDQIAWAAFAGAAYAETHAASQPAMTDDTANEAALNSDDTAADDTAMSVLVVPDFIDATLNINARNITYSDLVFRDFKGVLSVYDGAINLSRLSARSDVGSLDLNALYSAPTKHDASFAFGMKINDFHVAEFLELIPAVDSIMPMLNGIDGVINADLAATTDLDSAMNLNIPSLKAALKISGDSLVVLDSDTYRTISKWLLFKNKNHNMIDSMTVEAVVDNSQLQMFPFIFNFDRYRLGVMGHNDMAMNFNYHVAILKSPLPFKFGINIKGNLDDFKVRLGRAKLNEKSVGHSISIADTTRINLINEIGNVFRRGVRRAKVRRLNFGQQAQIPDYQNTTGDTISHADSLYFIQQGLIR